jgi:NAD(P)-dependent dehydrogenase (short-subunit alcohol dehydrogenase family)
LLSFLGYRCLTDEEHFQGAEIALSYAKAGATSIIISSRTLHELSSVSEKIHEINGAIDVQIFQCDVRSKSSVENLAEQIKEQFGRLDILVSSGM